MHTQISEIIAGKKGEAKIKCWLHAKRSSGKILFFIVRDGTGFLQCTLRKEVFGEKLDELEKLPIESVIEIEGEIKKDKRAPYGYEISAKNVNLISLSKEGFPIERKHRHTVQYLLSKRHLWLRSKKMQRVLIIRSEILKFIREWFLSRGYKEFHSPIFTEAACEGGATLFPVKYFNRTVYLTQSWQLYAEAAIASLGKIFTVAPSFRAEKSRTRRHLTEYWHVEAEIPFCDFNLLLKEMEEFISFVCKKAAQKLCFELKEFGRNPEDLMKVEPEFPRIKYDEAIEILQKEGMKIEWGQDLGADEERVLASKFEIPFFVTHYPKGVKAFYHKVDRKNPKVTLSADMLAPEGYGEIIGSGEREDDYETLLKRIEEEKMNPKDYEWYLDLRRFGSVQHSGFGLGLERFIMWICKLKHIRDAIAFPRLINVVYP